MADRHVRDTHNRCRSGGAAAGGGALGCVIRSSGAQPVACDSVASAGTAGLSGARMPFGATHCSWAIGQLGPWSGDSAAAGAAACPLITMCDDISIGPGIAIAGRASPVRQAKSAHTSSTPDHDSGRHRDMRAMLGQAASVAAQHPRARASGRGSGSRGDVFDDLADDGVLPPIRRLAGHGTRGPEGGAQGLEVGDDRAGAGRDLGPIHGGPCRRLRLPLEPGGSVSKHITFDWSGPD